MYEYRIDKNIYYDSDGDGDPANDIDNQSDISFLTGAGYTAQYQASWEKIATKLTVTDEKGNQDSEQVEIVFAEEAGASVSQSGNLIEAKLLNLPRQNPKDQKVYLA